MNININDITYEIHEIIEALKLTDDYAENPIDNGLGPIPPFVGSNNIKLIIIGQDPTIQNVTQRAKVTSTLNLDKKGSLRNYTDQISNQLGIGITNVYATNIFKYFYTIPPQQTLYVLHSHLEKNLELLRKELELFPNVPIITLGLPVLQLLAGPQSQISYYWDYNKKTKTTNGNFKYCSSHENKLNQNIFLSRINRVYEKNFIKVTY